jgi:Fungal specific transcription factor domain/Fungal Zn(2)-Cys(6) binuclear cluster domain
MMPTDPQQQQQPLDPQTGDTRRKRAKIVSACSECRRKKTKCNGEIPCKNCAKSGVRCEYPTLNNEDRRNAPTKAAVEAIEDRLKTIEGMLRTILESGSDPASALDKDSMMQFLIKDRSPSKPIERPASQPSSSSVWSASSRREIKAFTQEPRPRHHSMTTAMSASSNYAPPPLAASMSSSTSARDYYSSPSYQTFASAGAAMRRASVDYKPTRDHSSARSPHMSSAAATTTEDIMEGLESVQPRKREVRLPSIADLAGQQSFSLSSSAAQAEEALSSQQLPPLNVQEYLFGIYFDHVYMFSPVVDRRDLEMKLQVIRQQSSADNSQPLSTLSSSAASSVLLLAYSIMAVASEIIPSHTTLPLFSHNEYVRHSADVCSKHFFDRAMALADTLPTNQLSTISALCILSRYIGKNDQKQVDLTMSLLSRANRAAISFGLHMGEMMDQNWEDPRETLLRKKLFWAIFCHERLLGGLHARPFEIEEDEIYVDLPDRNSEAPVAYYLEKEETKKREAKRVLPYMNQPYLDDMLKSTIERIHQDMETEVGTVDFFLAYIKLVKLMGRVVKHNNAQGSRSDFWPVNTLHRALTNWMTGLPRKYQWSLTETYSTESRAPVHVQLLHFLFHMTMLILHRPHAIGRTRQEVSYQHYLESSKSIILHSDALNSNDANVCNKDIIFQQALVCATRAQLDLLGSIVRQSSVTPSSTPSEVENLAVKSVNQLKAIVLASSTASSSDAAKSRDDVNVLYSAVVTLENDLYGLVKKYRPDDERFGVPMSPEHKRDHDYMESVSESSSPAQTPEHKMERPMLTPRSPRMKLAQIQQQKQQQRPSTGPSLMSLVNGGRQSNAFGSDDGKSYEFVPAVFNAANGKCDNRSGTEICRASMIDASPRLFRRQWISSTLCQWTYVSATWHIITFCFFIFSESAALPSATKELISNDFIV